MVKEQEDHAGEIEPPVNRATELVEVIREAMKPRLLYTVPLTDDANPGAQTWEQPGAEEIAVAVAAWLCPTCNPGSMVATPFGREVQP